MQGTAGLGGIGAVAYQEWTLRYGLSSPDLQEAIYTLVWWIANTYPHWEAYRAIFAGLLIGLDNFPGVQSIIIGEILQRMLGTCVLEACDKDVTNTHGV